MRDAENIPRVQFATGERAGRPGADEGPGTGPSGNEWPYRQPVEVLRRLIRPASRDDEAPGYVIHLPVRVSDLAAATALAGTVATSLGFLGELDAGETTVSTADDQNNRHRVFCDLLLADRTRCPQRYDHEGPCGEPPAPEQRPASR
ncbi:hypothetical protein ONA70_13440 [Micromonospora yasonensis]|uniref:hypothetical protein n=1 Tax=Micromonospora yasonensis TaxID=1128667 RepID=UPI00222F182F|nr:hypothetical protein [Micromonospora yasonensis]MCW3841106.1 hypothetical protein [Micromonospora yasonensis]